ncbi:hypothetical protein HYPDE_26533 [Hyphomicrobium denitrificans 1NES1]|uniref:Uncharacterized protein n=1 Tax=Hyphomicrobium denitrificans 1NES1 TaxID=670307 RepID=N0B473_9HYPH|nr:hypothetical protein HYPDE_26533 [Hyphomicrobium denitrificans 1NES1]
MARRYASCMNGWPVSPRSEEVCTHSLRRTRAVLIYSRTGNLRAVQESTAQYLGIEVDDAIEIAEKIDI